MHHFDCQLQYQQIQNCLRMQLSWRNSKKQIRPNHTTFYWRLTLPIHF